MKIKASILGLLCSVLLVGCTQESDNVVSNSKGGGSEITNPEREEIEDSKTEDETSDSNDSNGVNNEDVTENNEEGGGIDEDKFHLYTVDEMDTDKVLNIGDLEIEKQDVLYETVREVCNSLQTHHFKDEDAKIELKGIDEEGIAIINLVNGVEGAWDKHFAGSTGGYVSQMTIIETLLQRDYKGEWINGLKVLVDGKDALNVYDHAPFEELYKR